MASTTQDKLYETFVAVSGQQDSNLGGALDSGEEIASSLSDTVKQLGELQGSSQAQAASGGSSSSSSSTSSASTSSSGGSTAESIASTVLESGLGMVPLIVGLLGLFEGGGTPAPTLEKYAMPERQYFEGADTGSDISDADYDQMGMPRTYSAAPDGTTAQTGGTASPGSTSSGSAASGGGAAQITVNVQAMDSQSFLDHSNEIAQAVRAAMLNSNSINDVVNNL
jgi:hypothetical protein